MRKIMTKKAPKWLNPDPHHFVNPKRSLTLFDTNDEYPLPKYQSGAKAQSRMSFLKTN